MQKIIDASRVQGEKSPHYSANIRLYLKQIYEYSW